MKRFLLAGEISSATNPALDTICATQGNLVVPFSLAFEIRDVTTDAKAAAPVVLQAKTALDLAATKVPGTSKGHYFAPWAVPAPTPVGRYEITWFMKLLSTSAEVSWRLDFDVVSALGRSPGVAYALVSDMRYEGVHQDKVPDARMHQALLRASRVIDGVTGRTFGPTYKNLDVDGSGRNLLVMSEPIVAVGRVLVKTEVPVAADTEIDPSYFRVYNRHLTNGLVQPDDRDSPKMSFIDSRDLAGAGITMGELGLTNLRWPYGRQNIHVEGFYGYTDPDGASPCGIVPEQIRWCCQRLAMRELPRLSNIDEREDRENAHKVTGHHTREQSINYNPALVGGLTGDTSIDQILIAYMRPPEFGAT